MSKTVGKKILPEFFNDVCNRVKSFELRKDEDDIQVGDTIVLNEWDEGYTGRYISKKVIYVLRDCERYGLMNGYCIIGLGDTLDYNL